MNRAGYHRWRQAVHARQGEQSRELLQGLVEPELAERVAQLVSKRASDEDGQALEDAACLVFLEREIAGFAAEHPDYTEERYIRILQRTMRKMSLSGLELVNAMDLPALIAKALPEPN
jgi:uncharacterized protein YicC (UPF0701 family)